MSRREKKLVAVVVLLIAASLAMAVWMQRRARYVEEVLRGFADLDRQLERLDPEGLPARRLKETRPHIQNLILEGGYSQARSEMEALREAQRNGTVSLIRFDKSLSVNQLLPPNSPERRRARQLLADLTEKERAGYDTEAVREELARMGGQALRGNRAQALRCLDRAQQALKKARKIPGLAKLAAETEHLPPLRPSPRGPGKLPWGPLAGPPALRSLPPRLQSRLQSLGLRLAQAYQQGRDVASLQPLLQELAQAVQRGQTERVRQLLRRIEMALPSLPPRKAGTGPLPPGGLVGPGLGPPAGKAPRSIPPALPSPFWPPDGGPGKLAPSELTPLILGVLDRIRAMPAEEYQKQRPFLGRMIGQLLQGAGRLPSAPPGPEKAEKGSEPPKTGPPPQPIVLALGRDAQLELSSTGQIAALRLGGQPLPLPISGPSGFCLEHPSEGPQPLTGTVRVHGSGALQQAQDSSGKLQLNAIYTVEGRGLVVRARLSRRNSGPSQTRLSYRLPLDAVDWFWETFSDDGKPAERVKVQAGQVYPAMPAGSPPWRAVLTGETDAIEVETSVAQAELGYDGKDRALYLTFPLSLQPPEDGGAASAVITFLLKATPSAEPAAPGFPPFPLADDGEDREWSKE